MKERLEKLYSLCRDMKRQLATYLEVQVGK